MPPVARRSLATAAALAGAAAGATAAGPAHAACTPAPVPATTAYARFANVPVSLTSLDVWRPGRCRPTSTKAPIVVWVHGGGYRSGDKRNAVRDKVRLFNGRGIVFVSTNYRLTQTGVPGTAKWPDHFRDVARAVAWVRANAARFGADPSRIALLGQSAGADIVSNVANDPRWLRERGLRLSALRCSGPLDTEGFDKARAGDRENVQWLAALGNAPDYQRATSATALVRRGAGIPRTVLVRRGNPRRQSILAGYADALRRAGVPATVIPALGLSHEDVNRRIGAPGDTVMTPPLLRFLDRCFAR